MSNLNLQSNLAVTIGCQINIVELKSSIFPTGNVVRLKSLKWHKKKTVKSLLNVEAQCVSKCYFLPFTNINSVASVVKYIMCF